MGILLIILILPKLAHDFLILKYYAHTIIARQICSFLEEMMDFFIISGQRPKICSKYSKKPIYVLSLYSVLA
jgi:hypothetical protein